MESEGKPRKTGECKMGTGMKKTGGDKDDPRASNKVGAGREICPNTHVS